AGGSVGVGGCLANVAVEFSGGIER
ncbi:hypothetical protein MTO96_035453, partial [Rhipicephalus appendiculatus]